MVLNEEICEWSFMSRKSNKPILFRSENVINISHTKKLKFFLDFCCLPGMVNDVLVAGQPVSWHGRGQTL